eukprot:GCRY01006721.1.p1 GENE.GCRY01006721.1~~GCRY01006721.1.p1  ORF type:complete len:554 (-),score=41.96 GCRY01006721.1:296-1771(-)
MLVSQASPFSKHSSHSDITNWDFSEPSGSYLNSCAAVNSDPSSFLFDFSSPSFDTSSCPSSSNVNLHTHEEASSVPFEGPNNAIVPSFFDGSSLQETPSTIENLSHVSNSAFLPSDIPFEAAPLNAPQSFEQHSSDLLFKDSYEVDQPSLEVSSFFPSLSSHELLPFQANDLHFDKDTEATSSAFQNEAFFVPSLELETSRNHNCELESNRECIEQTTFDSTFQFECCSQNDLFESSSFEDSCILPNSHIHNHGKIPQSLSSFPQGSSVSNFAHINSFQPQSSTEPPLLSTSYLSNVHFESPQFPFSNSMLLNEIQQSPLESTTLPTPKPVAKWEGPNITNAILDILKNKKGLWSLKSLTSELLHSKMPFRAMKPSRSISRAIQREIARKGNSRIFVEKGAFATNYGRKYGLRNGKRLGDAIAEILEEIQGPVSVPLLSRLLIMKKNAFDDERIFSQKIRKYLNHDVRFQKIGADCWILSLLKFYQPIYSL